MNNFTLTTLFDEDVKLNVTFEYKFPSELNTIDKQISFMKKLDLYDETMDSYYEGDIIRKNPMTEQLINLMMLNDENLQTHSGHVTSECYRLSLIGVIKLLWD